MDADLVVMDAEFRVVLTLVEGKVVYQAPRMQQERVRA